MANTRMRPFDPGDIEQLTRLINATSVADSIPMQMSCEEVIAMLEAPNIVPQDDVRVVLVDYEIVGY